MPWLVNMWSQYYITTSIASQFFMASMYGFDLVTEKNNIFSTTNHTVLQSQPKCGRFLYYKNWMFEVWSFMISKCWCDCTIYIFMPSDAIDDDASVILTLYVLNFRRKHKIFTFHVIPSHWYDTGSWNYSSRKTGTYIFYIISIMAADILATQ